MEKYSIIHTPSELISVKKNTDLISFRPAATGKLEILEKLKLMTEMESLEDSIGCRAFASAAHLNEECAIRNAKNEFIERATLISWWKCGYRLSSTRVDNDYGLDAKFELHTGKISSFTELGYTAISILENEKEYPYIVLGSAYDDNPDVADEKATIEAVQSWTGSKWMQQHGQPVYWDLKELQKRVRNLKNEDAQDNAVDKTIQWDELMKIKLQKIGEIAVVSIDPIYNNETDFIKKITCSEPMIFTSPNF